MSLTDDQQTLLDAFVRTEHEAGRGPLVFIFEGLEAGQVGIGVPIEAKFRVETQGGEAVEFAEKGLMVVAQPPDLEAEGMMSSDGDRFELTDAGRDAARPSV